MLKFTLLILCTPVFAQIPSLYMESKAPVFEKQSQQVSYALEDTVLKALKSGELNEFRLPLIYEDKSFQVIHRVERGSLTTLQATSSEGEHLLMTLGFDHFFAYLETNEGVFEYGIGQEKAQFKCRKNETALDICSAEGGIPAEGPSLPPISRSQVGRNDDGSRIDIMVVYTTGFAAQYPDSLQARIQFFLDLANLALANSNVATTFNLVHLEEVTYDETSELGATLRELTDNAGVFSGLEAKRTTHGADQVTLIRQGVSNGCGVAWIARGNRPDIAYAVVQNDEFRCSLLTMAHEIGHNMGCAHDRSNANNPGRLDYSYGYQNPDGLFRTIMAYATGCPPPCGSILNFSNPQVNFNDNPTGIASTEQNSADNAQTLNISRIDTATYRTSPCNPATINAHPQSTDICDGGTLTLTVSSPNATAFQWHKNGAPMEGQTNAQLQISPFSESDQAYYSCTLSSECDTPVTTIPALVLLGSTTPLAINQAPDNLILCSGDTATFTVQAEGSNLSYQWYKDQTLLNGETNASLTINNVSISDEADYSCTISTACDDPQTVTANLSLASLTLTQSPQSISACLGDTPTFSVSVDGNGLTYTWYKNDVPIENSNNATLTFSDLSTADAGNYHCVITNGCATSTSETATLAVFNFQCQVFTTLPQGYVAWLDDEGMFFCQTLAPNILDYVRWIGNNGVCP